MIRPYGANDTNDGLSNLYDPESEAYIGRVEDIDAVGGVATLVRADVHRAGAMFPSWVEDHQVETEGPLCPSSPHRKSGADDGSS